MNGNAAGQHPQVFMVEGRDRRQVHPQQHPPRIDPGLVPCWTFPPARDKARGHHSWSGLITILVMVLVLVFAALALGAFQIQSLQNQLADLTKVSAGGGGEYLLVLDYDTQTLEPCNGQLQMQCSDFQMHR